MSDEKYAAAGVDYRVMDPAKLLAQRASAATAPALARRGASEVALSRGESAYVVDIGDRYLATVTEALGTKNVVADEVRAALGRSFYDQIGKDTVATILNDLASVGAEPLTLTAYWGTGSSEWFGDQARMTDLIEGWAAACTEAGVSWGGGETQVLSGMIAPERAVLGGSATGLIAPKERLLHGGRLEAGDVILIAPATGIHANGLTLARKVAASVGYERAVPGDARGRGFGEVLLDPAPLYGPTLEALFAAGVRVHYAVHVTGHGWRKVMRAARELTYVIDALPPELPIFPFLAEHAGLSTAEMYGTFNMGAGFAFFVPAADVDAARRVAPDLIRAGIVEDGPRRVVIRPAGVTFEGASLELRA